MNKNLYLLQTDKPSRFYKINQKLVMNDVISFYGYGTYNQHLYITSEERIEKRDWSLEFGIGKIFKAGLSVGEVYKDLFKKIILTTDQELIDDGVQAIDDDFLEWFVKNPNYEEVAVYKDLFQVNQNNIVLKGSTALVESYKIIIPKEEPKQETLEDLIYQTIGLAANQQGIINQALATSNVMKVLQERRTSFIRN